MRNLKIVSWLIIWFVINLRFEEEVEAFMYFAEQKGAMGIEDFTTYWYGIKRFRVRYHHNIDLKSEWVWHILNNEKE